MEILSLEIQFKWNKLAYKIYNLHNNWTKINRYEKNIKFIEQISIRNELTNVR